MMRLIFSAVSTFVFSNNAKILDNALINRFLLLSPVKSWSNSSCTDSDRSFRKSKTPSVASLSLFSLDRKAFNYLFISSKSCARSPSTIWLVTASSRLSTCSSASFFGILKKAAFFWSFCVKIMRLFLSTEFKMTCSN